MKSSLITFNAIETADLVIVKFGHFILLFAADDEDDGCIVYFDSHKNRKISSI